MRKLAILTKVLLVLAMGLAVAAPAGANGVPLKVCKELICYSDQGDGDGRLEPFEKWCFTFKITVKNNTNNWINDVVVTDNFGGELELIKVQVGSLAPVDVQGPFMDVKKETAVIGDGVTVLWTGKSRKVHLTWRVGDLGP
jgi:hypothetical protein